MSCSSVVFSQLRTADVFRQSAILDRRRHSSAVEQLFRKSLAVCAVLQAWRADTNGHTYQLFDSGPPCLRSTLGADLVETDPDHARTGPLSHPNAAFVRSRIFRAVPLGGGQAGRYTIRHKVRIGASGTDHAPPRPQFGATS